MIASIKRVSKLIPAIIWRLTGYHRENLLAGTVKYLCGEIELEPVRVETGSPEDTKATERTTSEYSGVPAVSGRSRGSPGLTSGLSAMFRWPD